MTTALVADADASRTSPQWRADALAQQLDAELRGSPDVVVDSVDALDHAGPSSLTFIRDAKHSRAWTRSPSPCAVVTRGCEPDSWDPQERALLVVDDADHAMQRLLEAVTPPHVAPPVGAHPTAAIDPSACVDPSCRIGPFVAIGPKCRVEADVVLHARVSLGAEAVVGAGSELRAGVVVEDRCQLGQRVLIHPNAVIGADGFGYLPTPQGPVKIPHAGFVLIEDDVEIGACTTIDRGKFGPTRVGRGTKIDNHVQIGHNCDIGQGCIICGACALSGSVRVGDGAILAGGVGIKDNVAIGPRARVGARSGVMNDIPEGETWVGYPARPASQTMRIIAAETRLPEIASAVRRFTKQRPRDAQANAEGASP
ncbi:MAG: UDP-3-O-(3-hydroxymyristoyl)glucosamine N-acyltransferase [Planctomycetota bacterium]|nr:MAG: UDP-3-O-(3-hydroxymyristoyl)glucosamine N-acyltransferase [Planctomycetota bacterium]